MTQLRNSPWISGYNPETVKPVTLPRVPGGEKGLRYVTIEFKTEEKAA